MLVDQINRVDNGVIFWPGQSSREALFCNFFSASKRHTLTEERGCKLWWTVFSSSSTGSRGVSASRCQSSSSASTEPSSDGGGSKTINQLQYINYFRSKVGPSCQSKAVLLIYICSLQGLQSHRRWGRGGPNCCSIASGSRICSAETRRQKKYPSNLMNINSHTEKDRESREKNQ